MPAVSGQVPVAGSALLPTTPIAFSVTGIVGSFAIGVTYPDGQFEVVWDGTVFAPWYLLNSVTAAPSGGNQNFSILRTGGWKSAPTVVLTTAFSSSGVASVAGAGLISSTGGATPVISFDATQTTKLTNLDDGTVSAFTTGTPTLVAKLGGHVNRLSGTVAAALLPPAVVGQSAHVLLVNLGATVVTPNGTDTINATTSHTIAAATDPLRTVFTYRCDAAGQWTVGSSGAGGGGGGISTASLPLVITGSNIAANAVSATASGLAPAQAVTTHTTGTGVLVTDVLGAMNGVAGASALTLPAGTVGQKSRVRLESIGSDITITATGSDLINGNTTYVLRGTQNAYAWVDLECVAVSGPIGAWVAHGSKAAVASGDSGYLTGADQAKLNGITAGAAVASVAVTSPATNSGTATAPNISVQAASASLNGYLTSTDYSLIHTAAATATNSALCQRDTGGACAFTAVTTSSVKTAFGPLAISSFSGVYNYQVNSTTQRIETLNPTGANTVVWQAGTSLTDSIAQQTTGAGIVRSLYGQQGQAGFVGGNTIIGAGAGGTPGTNLPGKTIIDLGTAVSGTSATQEWWVGGAKTLSVNQPNTAVMQFDAPVGGSLYFQAPVQLQLISNGLVQLFTPQFYTSINSLFLRDTSSNLRRTMTVAAAFADQFDASCTSITTNQADNTTASTTGATMTYAAQNATGTTSVGGTLALTGGTGTTRGGNVCLGATSMTSNGLGTGLFIASATAVPTAAPSGGIYGYVTPSIGNMRAVDSGNLTADLHPSFKADQTVAFTPITVATYKVSGSCKVTTGSATPLVCTIPASLIPSAGNASVHIDVKVQAVDTTVNGTYVGSWRVAAKVVSGTLSMESAGAATAIGAAIDNTTSAFTTVVTGTATGGAILLKPTTAAKGDTLYIRYDCDVYVMRAT